MFWWDITRHFLRARARHPETWRDRLGFGGLYVAAASWSALAPQARLSLGERLHLGFRTIAVLMIGVALLAAFRHPNRPFASGLTRGVADILPAVPLLGFLVAVQSISLHEFLFAAAVPVLIIAATMAVGPILFLPICVLAIPAMRHRSWFEASLVALYAGHLYAKLRFAHDPVRSLHQLRRFDPTQPALLFLLFCHVALLACARFWPLDMERSLALGLILIFGVVSLYVDASALHWRRVLKVNPLANIAVVLGIPWSVAWVFATLRTGDAFALNEGAAYFFVWMTLGSALSWKLGSAAKEKAQREIISLSLCPSEEAP